MVRSSYPIYDWRALPALTRAIFGISDFLKASFLKIEVFIKSFKSLDRFSVETHGFREHDPP